MIYNRIKEECKKNGVSINTLEKELGFAKGSLCKIDNHTPSAKKIQLIADYLKVDADYLMEGKSKEGSFFSFKPEHLEMISMYESANDTTKKTIIDVVTALTRDTFEQTTHDLKQQNIIKNLDLSDAMKKIDGKQKKKE